MYNTLLAHPLEERNPTLPSKDSTPTLQDYPQLGFLGNPRNYRAHRRGRTLENYIIPVAPRAPAD
jgi:hypothetical protein